MKQIYYAIYYAILRMIMKRRVRRFKNPHSGSFTINRQLKPGEEKLYFPTTADTALVFVPRVITAHRWHGIEWVSYGYGFPEKRLRGEKHVGCAVKL